MSDDGPEVEAAAARAVSDPPGLTRALLYRERHGVLSTLSVHREGYPYGSVTPYAISARGAPLILISTIAAHTKNLVRDPRASLFVQEREAIDDPQAGGRITLMGLCQPVSDEPGLQADARARYLARFPKASEYFKTHDFVFYELAIEEVRLISGFGKICWLPGTDVLRDPAQDPLVRASEGVCRHMNEDHADALAGYCRVLRGLTEVTSARMEGLDGLGFDVVAQPGAIRLRFDFERELSTTDEVRRAMVALVGEVRRRTAPAG